MGNSFTLIVWVGAAEIRFKFYLWAFFIEITVLKKWNGGQLEIVRTLSVVRSLLNGHYNVVKLPELTLTVLNSSLCTFVTEIFC